MRILGSFWLWVGALLIVAGVAFAVSPSSPGEQARIAHLESLVKCPACDDLSVAQSNATSAIAVRHEIVNAVRSGASDNKILTTIEAQYGSSILLSPSTSGVGVLLWAAPVAVVILGVVVAWRLVRRRS